MAPFEPNKFTLIRSVHINYKYHPQFFTATIYQWKHLLKEDEYKDIMIKKPSIFEQRRKRGDLCFCYYAKSFPLNLANTGWL